jgi:hypothetical protein
MSISSAFRFCLEYRYYYLYYLGVIGPMLIDEIEKYARETDRTDNIHWLKISHIGRLLSNFLTN